MKAYNKIGEGFVVDSYSKFRAMVTECLDIYVTCMTIDFLDDLGNQRQKLELVGSVAHPRSIDSKEGKEHAKDKYQVLEVAEHDIRTTAHAHERQESSDRVGENGDERHTFSRGLLKIWGPLPLTANPSGTQSEHH